MRQPWSIREEKITMYGRIYALFGSFLACQFLFCYDPRRVFQISFFRCTFGAK